VSSAWVAAPASAAFGDDWDCQIIKNSFCVRLNQSYVHPASAMEIGKTQCTLNTRTFLLDSTGGVSLMTEVDAGSTRVAAQRNILNI
jgi:hypothetical protein